MSQPVISHAFHALPYNSLLCSECGGNRGNHPDVAGYVPPPAPMPASWAPAGPMTFGAAISSCFRQYAVFTGRAGRAEYWWFTLLQVLVIGTGALLAAVAGGFGIFLLVVAVLGLILPSLAVLVRRLHDTDRSGGWYFVGLLPFGGLLLLVLTLSAGTRGPNRYGPQS